MKTQAIVPTAGLGIRFQANIPKTLIKLKGKPLFVYSLEAIDQSPQVDSIILVVPKEHLDSFHNVVNAYSFQKEIKVVIGGVTRSDSVLCGIQATDKDTDIVLIHDGARPLIDVKTINEAVDLCVTKEAVIVAVPITSTIKQVDVQSFLVKKTLSRDELWEVQTPQVFKKALLVKAYDQCKGSLENFTDDAALVESLGEKVSVLKGNYRNIKITASEDLIVAEALTCKK